MKLRFLSVCLAAALLSIASPGLAQARRPNIVLVMTDDQGYGDIGRNGNPVVKTPNIDRLFEDGVRLTNFHVDPTCSPTRAALMTGRHSLSAGVWHTVMGRSLMPAEQETIAERLRASGYVTGIFGKWHLGDNYPFRPQDQGFDRVVIHGGGGVGQISDAWGNTQTDDTYFVDGAPTALPGYSTEVWFDQATRFIETNRSRPFFAYIATNAPHSPWRAPEADVQPYLDMGLPVSVARFYGMVSNVDRQVGRLRARLAALGIERDTILIFMTDNGSSLNANDTVFGDYKGFMQGARHRPGWERWTYNAGLRGFKNEVYEGGHRVPLVIRWPNGGLGRPRDVDTLSAHFDLFPTLLDLVGLPPRTASLDGRSLAPELKGVARGADRTLVITNQRVDIPRLTRPNVVMTQRWRLVVDRERGVRELFDIQADPGQAVDLAALRPEMVAQLEAALEDWWRRTGATGDVRQRIVIGSDRENPSRLTAMDWMEALSEADVPWFPGFQPPLVEPRSAAWIGREAEFRPLPWYVRAERAGTYRLSPFLHDREAARPIGRRFALLEIDGKRRALPVPGLASWADFKLPLTAGDHQVRAWFADDEAGTTAVLPAFYLYAERLTPAPRSAR